MSKLLSIAIPTYNRSKYLKEELDSIIPQLLPYDEDVEVVISDNASTDDTAQVIETIEKKYAFSIKYVKLEKGVYFEDNFENAVNLSEGRYVQMAGDDDIMAPGFYDLLIRLLKNDYGLLYFNRLSCDVNCCNGKLYDNNYKGSFSVLNLKDFVSRVGSGPGFMTSLIFRRDCWVEGLRHKSKLYYGYNFLGQLYQGALHLDVQCYYCYFPMVLQRSNAHGFSKTYPLYQFVALPSILMDVDRSVAENWIKKNLRGHNNTMILAKVYCEKEFYRNHAEEMLCFLSNKQKRIFRFMISSYTPIVLCRLHYKWLSWFC